MYEDDIRDRGNELKGDNGYERIVCCIKLINNITHGKRGWSWVGSIPVPENNEISKVSGSFHESCITRELLANDSLLV